MFGCKDTNKVIHKIIFIHLFSWFYAFSTILIFLMSRNDLL